MENRKERTRRHGVDIPFLILSLLMVLIGFLTMASAYAGKSSPDSRQLMLSFFRKQLLIYAAAGGLGFMAYKMYWKAIRGGFAWLAYFVILVLMALTHFFGVEGMGAVRCLQIGPFTLQPSEFMKIALVLVMANFVSAFPLEYRKSLLGLLRVGGYLLLPLAVTMGLQNHMSVSVIFIAMAGSMLFVSGMGYKSIIAGVAGAVTVLAVYLFTGDGFRLQRIQGAGNIFDPDKMLGQNWQSIQSLYAIASGGLFGRGYTQSREKYSWLPMADNDYIFSIFAEECGFVMCVLLVLLFCAFLWRGFLIAMKMPNGYLSTLAFGCMMMFAIQILWNLLVVLCVLPSTGIQLPFFSSGGTSMLTSAIAVGLVLNASQYTEEL